MAYSDFTLLELNELFGLTDRVGSLFGYYSPTHLLPTSLKCLPSNVLCYKSTGAPLLVCSL